MKDLKLTVELVPKTSWCSNLRSELTKGQWDKVRKDSYRSSGYKCDCCGGIGPKHPVECHEIWDYNDDTKVQKLLGVTSLCPSCHEVKHIGRAIAVGKGDKALSHFVKVNKVSMIEANRYIEEAFNTYHERSNYDWKLDLTWLLENNYNFKKK